MKLLLIQIDLGEPEMASNEETRIMTSGNGKYAMVVDPFKNHSMTF